MASFVESAQTLSGVVTHLRVDARVSGSSSSSVSTSHDTRFRVDGKPCAMWGTSTLSDGDRVALIGHQAGDVVRVFALKNLTTGTWVNFKRAKKWQIYMFMGLGLVLLPVYGIGLVFIGLGLLAMKAHSNEVAMLKRLDAIGS